MKALLIRWINWLADKRLERAKLRAVIDPNARCPACGHCNGKLTVVTVHAENQATKTMVQHQCNVCSAKFYEDTVVKPEKWVSKRPQVGGPIKKIPPPINDEKPFAPGN